jgi:hypothetical protein
MKIEATASASRRTRNRICENGRYGFLMSGRKNVDGLGMSWLLRSRDTKWLGWLPVNEFRLGEEMK